MSQEDLHLALKEYAAKMQLIVSGIEEFGLTGNLSKAAYELTKYGCRTIYDDASGVEKVEVPDKNIGPQIKFKEVSSPHHALMQYLQKARILLSGLSGYEDQFDPPIAFSLRQPQKTDKSQEDEIDISEPDFRFNPPSKEELQPTLERMKTIIEGIEKYASIIELQKTETSVASLQKLDKPEDSSIERTQEEWSPPMSKTEIARRLTRNHSTRAREVEGLLQRLGIEKVSDKKYRVRMDTMDKLTHQNIQKPLP